MATDLLSWCGMLVSLANFLLYQRLFLIYNTHQVEGVSYALSQLDLFVPLVLFN